MQEARAAEVGQPGGAGATGHMGCAGLTPRSLPLCLEKFNQHIVSYQDLAQNPGLLDDPNLVVKINEKWVSGTGPLDRPALHGPNTLSVSPGIITGL